jgi:glyoxylase-like metal-dependent hydrolase (beta-lactamase superfamily II)
MRSQLVVLSLLLAATIWAQSRGVVPTEPSVSPVETGILPKSWRPAGPNCVEVPDWQIHEYNANFFILRESGCINYEKPFLYLIFGRDKALLEDTGAGTVDTASTVNRIIAQWAERNHRTTPVPLIVIHSHAHGDHTAGDPGFKDKPNVQFVAATVPEVSRFAGIQNWPEGIGRIDLGDRTVDVIPIPGHDPAGIALYDRQTGILLSGDSLYPGRLYVPTAAFTAFLSSNQHLVDFTKNKTVAHILGTHIEQTRTPFMDYPRGTVYQPDEHVLELSRGDLLELNDALLTMRGKPILVALRDMTIYPR